MDKPGYQAIQWAEQNTAPGSVFVSDALYGWWLGGFAQRPTLSAVQPQYLTVDSELAPATFASNLLDTDYMIDNGYIQVREDGGFIGRHNPEFLADLNWTPFPVPFFQFNDSEITLLSQNAGSMQSTDITQMPVVNMQLVGAQSHSPSIVVNKANSDFSYSEILTVSQGVAFANMTIVIQSDNPERFFRLDQFHNECTRPISAAIQQYNCNVRCWLERGRSTCFCWKSAASDRVITRKIPALHSSLTICKANPPQKYRF